MHTFINKKNIQGEYKWKCRNCNYFPCALYTYVENSDFKTGGQKEVHLEVFETWEGSQCLLILTLPTYTKI